MKTRRIFSSPKEDGSGGLFDLALFLFLLSVTLYALAAGTCVVAVCRKGDGQLYFCLFGMISFVFDILFSIVYFQWFGDSTFGCAAFIISFSFQRRSPERFFFFCLRGVLLRERCLETRTI